MITRAEDLRPGRYWVRRKDSGHGWEELTILPLPPDATGYVVFRLKSDIDSRIVYGLLEANYETPHIHYPHLVPIPIEIQPIDTPQASISHVRRVEL